MLANFYAGFWCLAVHLADPVQLNDIAHFADLGKGSIQLLVIANVYAEVDDGSLGWECFNLSTANINIVVAQSRENVFQHTDAINYFNLYLDWVG